jgi:hypothetical protein
MGKKSKSNKNPQLSEVTHLAEGTYNIDPNQISEDSINAIKMSMDPSAIPDLGDILQYVDNLIEFVEKPEMIILKGADYQEFEKRVYQRYNQFMPIKIIGLLIDEDERYDNLTKLLDMFDRLENVKRGNSNIQTEYEDFSEKLNEQYLYPVFGGKEKFIETMKTNPNAILENPPNNNEDNVEVEVPSAPLKNNKNNEYGDDDDEDVEDIIIESNNCHNIPTASIVPIAPLADVIMCANVETE